MIRKSKKYVSFLIISVFILSSLIVFNVGKNNPVNTAKSDEIIAPMNQQTSNFGKENQNLLKWVSPETSVKILNVFTGNFDARDNTYEVAALYQNGSIIFYNTTFDQQGFITSKTVNWINNTFGFVEYYIYEYNATQGNLWLYNTTHTILYNSVVNGTVFHVDIEEDGWTEIIAYNETLLEIYFFNKTKIEIKAIKPDDITNDPPSYFKGKMEVFDFDTDSPGKEFLAIIRGSTYYGAIFKVNRQWLNYTIYGADTYTTYFYDGFIIDLSAGDGVLNMFLYLYTVTYAYYRYIYEMDAVILDYSNNTDTAYNVESKPFNPANLEVGFRIRLTHHVDGYTGVLLKVNNSNTYYFTYSVDGEVSNLQVYSFTYDLSYTPYGGWFGGDMDDILFFKPGVRSYTILPGENLVSSSSDTVDYSSLSVIYSVIVFDVDKDGKEDLIFGEDGYIAFHKSPQQNVFYFDGKPNGPVTMLVKGRGNNDTVYDYLAVYNDTNTLKEHIYLMLADGEPPVIQELKIVPEKPTSRDSITIYATVTDNLHVSYVFASYEVLSLGTTFFKLDFVLLTKSTEGNVFYTTFPAPQLFDFLTDFQVQIFVVAADIFGNFDYEYRFMRVLSYLDSSTYHDIIGDLGSLDKLYYYIAKDVDNDNVTEAYFEYRTSDTNVNGFDTFIYYVDYSSPKYAFYNYTVDTATLGDPRGLAFYTNATGNLSILSFYDQALLVFSTNLTLINQFNFVDLINSSKVMDYDNDGVDEIFIMFYNETLSIYELNSGNLVREASYQASGVAYDDFVYSSGIIYGAYENTTHVLLQYINTTSGLAYNITWLNSEPSYKENMEILSTIGDKVFIALENGTICIFNTTYINSTSIPNTLPSHSIVEGYMIWNNEIILADTAGYVYIFAQNFTLLYQKKVTFGALPMSIEYIDIDRDNVEEISVSYYENYLNFIDINDNKDLSLTLFLKGYIFGGNYDNETGNEFLMVSERGVFLVHDVSKYYTLVYTSVVTTTEVVQGQYISAYVDILDIFGRPINDSNVYVVALRPDGSKSIQNLAFVGNGRYSLSLSTDGWMYGTANLTIYIQHEYYNDYNFTFSVLVRPELVIISQDVFEADHGSSLKISFDVRDKYDYKVLGAYGNVTLNGVTVDFYYNATSKMYEAVFSSNLLLNLKMGEHNATITVEHSLALTHAERMVKVAIFSTLSVSVTVTPQSVIQGNDFNVNISIYDAGGHYINDSFVEVEVNNIKAIGYNVTFSTINWHKGNYTITIRAQHVFSRGLSITYSYIIVVADPVIVFNYTYVDYGVDLVTVEVRDLYGELLTDVSVNLEVLGTNISLSGEGVYTAYINFTQYAPQRLFNVMIYVFNGTFVKESSFGPYAVEVKISGSVEVFIQPLNSSRNYLAQGDTANITVIVYDMFGNRVSDADVDISIFGINSPLTPLGNGIYAVNLTIPSKSRGTYTYSVTARWSGFLDDVVSEGNVPLYATVTIAFNYTYVDYGVDLVTVEVRDLYGELLTDVSVNLEVLGTNISLSGEGVYTAYINFTQYAPQRLFNVMIYVFNGTFVSNSTFGPYAVEVKISGSVEVFIQPLNTSRDYLAQGDMANITVIVYDMFGNRVSDADVEISIFGINSPLTNLGNGVYAVNLTIPSLSGDVYEYNIIVHWYGFLNDFIESSGSVVLYSEAILYFEYSYADVGTDNLYIELNDLYGELLTDGSLVLEIEGTTNITLEGSGVFTVTINFTNYANLNTFNVKFYLVNGTYVKDHVFGPFVVDVKLSGKINTTIQTYPSIEGNSSLYQGDVLNFTIVVRDQFGNPVDASGGVYLYIEGTPFTPTYLGNGVYQINISTYLWSHGRYSYRVEVYSDIFLGGVLTYSDEFLLLPIISPDVYQFNYDNATTLVDISFLDIYGYPLTNVNITLVNITPLELIYLKSEFGVGYIYLNGTMVKPGSYEIVLNITWHDEIFNVTLVEPIYVYVDIISKVKLYYYVYPENHTVIQGQQFYVAVEINTTYDIIIDDALVLFVWGQNIIPGFYSNGYYVASLDTAGFVYGEHKAYVSIFHPYISGNASLEIDLTILATPEIEFKSTSYGNKSVLISFILKDQYGNALRSGTVNISLKDKYWLIPIEYGKASILLGLSNMSVGSYTILVSVNGQYMLEKKASFRIDVVSIVLEENVNITAPGLASSTNDYPADAIVQGNDLIVNVTLYDNYSIPIQKATVKIIFAGNQYSPISKIDNVFIFQISTENLRSGHYTLIIQVSSTYIYAVTGEVLTISKIVYIKPEIHYEIDMPEQVQEGENFTITIRVLDKYGNPLPPIENMTNITIWVAGQQYVVPYDPETQTYTITLTAPEVGSTEVVSSYNIVINIEYEKETKIKIEDVEFSVTATPPVTNQQIESSQSYIWIITLVLTSIALVGYFIVRIYMFNEKLIKLFYRLSLILEVALIGGAFVLYGLHEFGYAEFLIVTAFVAIFPIFGLQIRLDQIKMFKVAFRSIMEEEVEEIYVNPWPYLFIYLSGAALIYIAFEIIGPNMIWFSRFILGGFKRIQIMHDITLFAIGFYLFAARGMYIKTTKYLKDLAENKLPTVKFAETIESRMRLFTNIVEDSIKAMGSIVITTTIYTLYLLGTYIWGASRLPMVNLNPATLIMLLAPVTLPIALIWLFQFVKLPIEQKVEKLVIAEAFV